MSLNQVIQDRLQSSEAAELLGGTNGGFSEGFSNGFELDSPARIYPVKPPENGAMPMVVYTIRPENDISMSGATGYIKAAVTVDIWAKENDECDEIVAAIKDSLNCWADRPQVMLMKHDSDNPVFNDDWFRTQSEYTIHYKEVA